jgi:hypothetical protein
MDNWGGARWTYNRKPRKFFKKRKTLFQDERQAESWEFKPPINYSTEKKDHKSILTKRIKQNRIKNILVLSLTIIPLGVICFVIVQKTNNSFNNYAANLQSIDSIQIVRNKLDTKKAYRFLINSGDKALENKRYRTAITEYETALRLEIATKSHYEKLLFASIMCCETADKYCDRVAHYEKIIFGLEQTTQQSND